MVTRNTEGYTPAGLLIYSLCLRKSLSFRRLAYAAGMSPESHSSITKACRGSATPRRNTLLAWLSVLDPSPQERTLLLRTFHYADDTIPDASSQQPDTTTEDVPLPDRLTPSDAEHIIRSILQRQHLDSQTTHDLQRVATWLASMHP